MGRAPPNLKQEKKKLGGLDKSGRTRSDRDWKNLRFYKFFRKSLSKKAINGKKRIAGKTGGKKLRTKKGGSKIIKKPGGPQ